MRRAIGLIIGVVVGVVVGISPAGAQSLPAPTEKPAPKKTPLPKAGSLSVSGSKGYGNIGLDLPWGGVAAPVSGSVSKLTAKEWVVRVFNNSKDTYSVDVEVVEYGDRGNKLNNRFDSFTLKPNGKGERKISVNPATTSCALNLRNWKNLSGNKETKKE